MRSYREHSHGTSSYLSSYCGVWPRRWVDVKLEDNIGKDAVHRSVLCVSAAELDLSCLFILV